MGRSGNKKATKEKAPGLRKTVQIEKDLSEYGRFVGLWEHKSRRGMRDGQSFLDQQKAQAGQLKELQEDNRAQIKLIKIAQTCNQIIEDYEDSSDFNARKIVYQATEIRSRAKGLFILSHSGFVEKFIGPHVNRFDFARGEQTYSSLENVREDLRVAAQAGLDIGIDRFDTEAGLKPMTYMYFWMQHKVGQEVEKMSKMFRAKGKTSDLVAKIEELVKEMKTSGEKVDIEKIAEKTGISKERAAEVMQIATEMPIRLDATPVSADSDTSSVRDLIVDPNQRVEEPVVSESERKWLDQAVEKLDSDFQKRVIRLYYGVGDQVSVPQNVLYDGVYIDGQGKRYSAEPSVLNDKDRIKRGEKVISEKQSVLNKKFKEGKLVFEPGSSESHELSRAALKKPFDFNQAFEKYITNETGVPPRSGTIQNAIKEAVKRLKELADADGMSDIN